MSVAIVIPLFQGELHIRACLDSLQKQSESPLQIIVVENGSTDAGPTIVATEYPEVELLRFPDMLGFAGAVNSGLRVALARPEPPEFLVTLNQDTIVDSGWLAALLAPFAETQVGIVGSLARFADGRVQHAGGTLIAPLWYGRNRTAIDDPAPMDYLAALAFALRVTMLEQIGLFDEGFYPAYFEDVDLCLRAAAAGWIMQLASDATLVHYEGALQTDPVRHAAMLERHRWRLLLKHCALTSLLTTVFPAERQQLVARAEQGMSQVLRQGYLHALLLLPTMMRLRDWSADEVAALSAELGMLRSQATAIEREQRVVGLRAALQPPAGQGGLAARHSTLSRAAVPADRSLPQACPPFTVGERPPIAIVMLTWNGLEMTRVCLTSLRAITREVAYQIIVVDNGSVDGTVAWLQAQPDVILIANTENRGFAAGVNQGLSAVPPGHDVLLLNNDTEIIEAHWLSHLCAVANDSSDYGIVGCLLLNSDGSLQHAGTYMPQHDFWGYQIGGGEPFIGQYPGVRETEGITGACMYIRRDALATIGHLDEAYFSYFEDTDYCVRATRAGFKIVCSGGAKLMHHENTSTRLNNANWLQMFSHGQRVFINKWREHYRQRYHRALLWHSLIAHATGYATSSREFVRELDRRGVDVRLACIFGTDYTEPPTRDPRIDQLRGRAKSTALTQVVYSQADAFIKNSGRYRVGFTMIESDALPVDWVAQSNQMDEIWVPAHSNREVFEASGVLRPIHIVPLGFNPNYFHPQIQGQKPENKFVFLSVFEWIERKAPKVLLRAYLDEFKASDDVVLILKVFNHDPHFDIRRQVHELTDRPGLPQVVLLLNQTIAEHQMGSLYRSADCFVLPTRGEGWGMPILEAMACGLPVITTDWGAQRDFFDAKLGYPLQIRGLIPAVARSPYYSGSRWADPDGEHLRYLMRYVYEHADEAYARGQHAADVVHKRWTWAHATDQIIARLEQIEQG